MCLAGAEREVVVREFGPEVRLADPAFIHPSAALYGKITAGRGVSFWINATLRSEFDEIVIGEYSNIQDFAMLHVGDAQGVRVGSHCSVAHRATLHGCTVGDNCLIGIGATVMDDCVIGDNSIVAPHSLVRQGTVVPPNSVVIGVPATVKKTRNCFVENRMNAFFYYHNALAYAVGEHRRWADPAFQERAEHEMARLRVELAAMQATKA